MKPATRASSSSASRSIDAIRSRIAAHERRALRLRAARLGGQGGAEAGEGAGRELLAIALGQRVERLDRDVGVARRRQAAADVAQRRVLLRLGGATDRVSPEPERCPGAFERLAGVVDRLGIAGAQAIHRVVDLAECDAADRVRAVLVVLETELAPLGLPARGMLVHEPARRRAHGCGGLVHAGTSGRMDLLLAEAEGEEELWERPVGGWRRAWRPAPGRRA